MRILHISTRLILGGSQENTILSCEGQARLGHDVHLAFGPIYGPEGSMLDRVQQFRTSDARTITTHVIPDMVRDINPRRDRRAYHQTLQLIDHLKPDIVHTHSSKAGIIGRAAAWTLVRRGGRLGVVHTIHGPPFMPVEGSPAARLKTRIINLAYTIAERRAARHCHVIVSVADAMTREFRRRGIGRDEQYTTVYSGMEVDRFLHPASDDESRDAMRRTLGFDRDDVVIGTVARLAQHKGHDDLLDALADDLRTHPHWKLLWVGDGWWRERLTQRAQSLGLRVTSPSPDAPHPSAPPAAPPANIVLTGLVPPERVPAMMRAMDVLAHPSYREGLPRTVPQALLCGVCPVAYNVDGTGEACIDRETGRLVPLADRARLREAIAWCANNPSERTALAERGRAMCRERFSAATMVNELEKVYARAHSLAKP